jgi:hypothetical protein
MAIDGQLFVVYANLAAYAFCFQMQQPVLPETVSKLVVWAAARLLAGGGPPASNFAR